jgi:hypothetical protein
LWEYVQPNQIPAGLTSQTRSTDFKTVRLDLDSVRAQLTQAPSVPQETLSANNLLWVPRPDGTLERFQIFVSSILAPELAAKFPEIQTYAGQGVDDPTATIYFDVTPAGFHAQVRSATGAFYIDPYSSQGSTYYSVYGKGTAPRQAFTEQDADSALQGDVDAFVSSLGDSGAKVNSGGVGNGSTASKNGVQLRTYRLAVAATGEYTAVFGGTVAQGQAAIVTAVNRVRGIYEIDASISFELIADNDRLVYTDAASDPYTNNDGFAMLSQNQNNVDQVIGNSRYDIGHVFSTGGGGVASLGSVGINSRKAQGVTGLPNPVGDDFYVDFVAHEIGHQFGGNHTFNSSAGSCGGGNRNASTAYEPGSGVSIQAYAGICGSDDLQPHSIPYFHSVSLEEFINHVDSVIPSVGARVNTGNNLPTVDGGLDYIIPADTPFVLTAAGTDGDAADVLTYDWQQRDLGPSTTVTAADNGSSPLFRVWDPTIDPSRTFPRLSDLIQNRTAIGEQLPTLARTMNFQVVVRDNRAGGGGTDTDDVSITVVKTANPFAVLTPNTNVSLEALTQQPVTWNVAGTTANGINTANVDISVSVDGGLTYPFLVAKGVPNSGSASIRIPNSPSTTARVRVQGSNNIFFDISDTNFTIVPASKTIDIQLGPTITFTENADADFVSPEPQVTSVNVPGFDGGLLTIELGANFEVGDKLQLVDQGNGPGQIGITANQISYGGISIGTFTANSRTISATLTSATTEDAIAGIISRVTFVNTSDDPSPNNREFTAYLDNAANGASNRATSLISVVPTNDPPVTLNTALGAISEDTVNPPGQSITSVLTPVFRDPDRNARLLGIVVVSNSATVAQGKWQYSLNGANWSDVGAVSSAAGLALSASTRLRFLPAKDYFGPPAPLKIRSLDETYRGGFSTQTRVSVNVNNSLIAGSIAITDSSISINILPVNDPPVAIALDQSFSTLQDQPLSVAFASTGLFTDVDNPVLFYSVLQRNGLDLPSWLAFDPLTNTLSGTPGNEEVGQYDLVLRATDAAGAFASIGVAITVINVNDAPTNIVLVGSSIAENLTGTFIGTLFGNDPDSADTFTWSTADSRFEIRGNQLFIGNRGLDFETTPQIALKIRVTDSGTPALFLEKTLNITVQDVNEFAPALRPSEVRLLEGTIGTSPVIQLVAPDGDTANTVRYRFVGTPPALFSISSESGLISSKPNSTIDYETATSYQFFVEAYDSGAPQLTTTASVNILIDDVNEFTPVISTVSIDVFENQIANVVFARIQASDADFGQAITLSLLPSESRFNIDPKTGDLSLRANGTLDFERSATESVTVIAKDPGGKSVQKEITIQILNSNDPPTAVTAASGEILSNISGLDLGAITVADQDVGQKYSVVSQDSRFVIRDGRLFVLADGFVDDSDPLKMFVPVIATEIGPNPVSYSLSIPLNRTPNPRPWQNRLNPLDVNNSSAVDPIDVLELINAINGGNVKGKLPVPRPASTLTQVFYDVDGDGFLSPLDILTIVNAINSGTARGAGEGEASAIAAPAIEKNVTDPNLWLSAFQQVEEEMQKRNRR